MVSCRPRGASVGTLPRIRRGVWATRPCRGRLRARCRTRGARKATLGAGSTGTHLAIGCRRVGRAPGCGAGSRIATGRRWRKHAVTCRNARCVTIGAWWRCSPRRGSRRPCGVITKPCLSSRKTSRGFGRRRRRRRGGRRWRSCAAGQPRSDLWSETRRNPPGMAP